MPGESSSIFLEKNSCGAVLVLLLAWIESFPWSELMSMQFSVFQLEIKDSSTIFKCLPSPPISTCGPWKCSGGQADEDLNEVVDDPGNDHVVVEADPYHDEKHGVSNSWGKKVSSQGID